MAIFHLKCPELYWDSQATNQTAGKHHISFVSNRHTHTFYMLIPIASLFPSQTNKSSFGKRLSSLVKTKSNRYIVRKLSASFQDFILLGPIPEALVLQPKISDLQFSSVEKETKTNCLCFSTFSGNSRPLEKQEHTVVEEGKKSKMDSHGALNICVGWTKLMLFILENRVVGLFLGFLMPSRYYPPPFFHEFRHAFLFSSLDGWCSFMTR